MEDKKNPEEISFERFEQFRDEIIPMSSEKDSNKVIDNYYENREEFKMLSVANTTKGSFYKNNRKAMEEIQPFALPNDAIVGVWTGLETTFNEFNENIYLHLQGNPICRIKNVDYKSAEVILENGFELAIPAAYLPMPEGHDELSLIAEMQTKFSEATKQGEE